MSTLQTENLKELVHDPSHILMSDVLKHSTLSDDDKINESFSPIVHVNYKKSIISGTFLSITDDIQKNTTELEFKALATDAIEFILVTKKETVKCNFLIDFHEKSLESFGQVEGVRISHPTSNGIVTILLRLEFYP